MMRVKTLFMVLLMMGAGYAFAQPETKGYEMQAEKAARVQEVKAKVSQAIASAAQTSPYVKMQVIPPRQYVDDSGNAVYDVIIYDRHPRPVCSEAEEMACPIPEHTYKVGVVGLPYEVEHPEEVNVKAGEKTRFKVYVDVRGYEDDQMPPSAANVGTESPATRRVLLRAPHKFRITAQCVQDSSSRDSATAVLYVGQNPDDEVEIELDKGWNTVSLPGKAANYNRLPDDVTAYVYLKSEGRYASFEEAIKIMGAARFRQYLTYNGFMAYAQEETVLKFQVYDYISYSGLPVDEGWNFIPVTKDMIGEELENISGSCSFEAMYLWDSENQIWNAVDEGYGFSEGDAHTAVVANAENKCQLGTTSAIAPPNLPS